MEFDEWAAAAMRERLEADPDARTYQFVAKAVPMTQEDLRKAARERAVADANDQLASRDIEVNRWEHTLQVETESLRAELKKARAENDALARRLDQVLTSRPMRAYARMRRLPGLRILAQRRAARKSR